MARFALGLREVSTSEEKRYDPTPARKRRALAEGNVARSAELSSVAAFGAAVVAVAFAVPWCGSAAAGLIEAVARHPAADTQLAPLASLASAALIPTLAAASAGMLAGIAQGGGLQLHALRLDPKRLDPIAGFKRMLGPEALLGVARATFALAATIVAMLPIVVDLIGGAAAPSTPAAAAAATAFAAMRAGVAAFGVGALFAIVDYALARRRWLRGLKMSFDELKRDAKESDGDPLLRARRRSAHREVARGGIARTREASFVVVNPTHVAVAMRYAPPTVPVPEILVRAVDDVALRVRELARAHGIPIVENAALARLLYAQGELGRTIPAETYVAVAHVVAALARDGLL